MAMDVTKDYTIEELREVFMEEMTLLHRSTVSHKEAYAEWKLIWSLWCSGRSIESIGAELYRHPSTIKTKLKKAFKRMLRLNGLEWWPKDKNGRDICDVPCPMPISYDRIWDKDTRRFEDAAHHKATNDMWAHARLIALKDGQFKCRICKRKGKLNKVAK